MNAITLLSPAKVNLTFEVLGTRPDGLHEIRSVVQPIDIFDEIRVELTDKDEIELETSGLSIPSGRDNLAVKAAERFLQRSKLRSGVKISIKKRIPLGSGLGGGSSNAAAVLVGLSRITRELTYKELMEIAPEIGADVAIFINSHTSIAQGIGEKIEALKDFPLFHYVIIYPNLHTSTADVYKKWDELSANGNQNSKFNFEESLALFKQGESKIPLFNELEKPAMELHPEIKSFKKIFESLDAKHVLMTGSGSAVYSVHRDADEAHDIHDYLKISPTFEVFLAKGLKGWHKVI